MPPALSRQKDDKRIPAQLLNFGRSRRQLQPNRKDIAREETFQQASLFGLVRAEGLAYGQPGLSKMLRGVRNTPMGWEVGYQTEGELVPTTAAGGHRRQTHVCRSMG